MKIDRLIGILSVLLQQDMVTAPFLAGSEAWTVSAAPTSTTEMCSVI